MKNKPTERENLCAALTLAYKNNWTAGRIAKYFSWDFDDVLNWLVATRRLYKRDRCRHRGGSDA